MSTVQVVSEVRPMVGGDLVLSGSGAVFPVNGASGPTTNRGQCGSVEGVPEADGALVDYLTLTFKRERLAECGVADPRLLLEYLFSFRGDVKLSRIEPRRWQFYERSGTLYDRDGELAGKVGIGNGDTVCVSLSGQGCKWVRNWRKARRGVDLLQGRITRVDVAHDDYDGERLSVQDMLNRARSGEFQDGPIAPKWKFLDDGGNGTGCTLYVGQKGHKQLCVYEKGKQLGMEVSKWVRLELRLYAKRTEIPSDVLVEPMKYLRGGYSVFSGILPGVCERLKTLKKTVEATGYAVVKWARRQVGPSLKLLHQALGGEFERFLQTRILRDGAPSRFRGIPKSECPKLIRETLDEAMRYLPVPGVDREENSNANLCYS